MNIIIMIPEQAEVGFLKSSIIDFTFDSELIRTMYLVDDNGDYIVDDDGKYIVPDDLRLMNI